jgi:nucleotide-binding universal stress UspA family protein
MFKHLVVPTDFGEPAQAALNFAIELAKTYEAKLTLLHVYGVPTVYYPDSVAWPLEELARAAQTSLDTAVAQVRERYNNTHGHVEVGDPREAILKYAKESGADLLVIGTHGRTGLAHLVLGSVAEWLVRMAPLPVLTVSTRTNQDK